MLCFAEVGPENYWYISGNINVRIQNLIRDKICMQLLARKKNEL